MNENSAMHAGFADRVVTLLRYYGTGKRALFVSKICEKAARTPDQRSWLNGRSPWMLYNRLCDIGLIHQVGDATSIAWQWNMDRVVLYGGNTATFPAAVAAADGFGRLLELDHFEQCVLYKSGFDREPEIRVHGYSTVSVADVMNIIAKEALPIRIERAVRLIKYLPSAQDIFTRTADKVDTIPESGELQHRICADNKWVPSSRPEEAGAYLLRKSRDYSPGFQYWLVDDVSNDKYELRRSDWIPLILLWFARNRSPLTYKVATSSLDIPISLFYALPGLVRFSLVSLSPTWPDEVVISAQRILKVKMKSVEAQALQHLYAPAIQISYE